jgi:hypothetical protein
VSLFWTVVGLSLKPAVDPRYDEVKIIQEKSNPPTMWLLPCMYYAHDASNGTKALAGGLSETMARTKTRVEV